MHDILSKILAHKQLEVAAAKQQRSLAQLRAECQQLPSTYDFISAITTRLQQQQPAIIAEIKRASPSKGLIRADFDPVSIADSYIQAGASCLSILTDEQYFQGSLEYLRQVRAMCNLPLLRKDFIIEDYQVYEARLAGADAILLIVAALDDTQLQELSTLATQLGLAVLVEVHDLEELQRALALPCRLIGINNRNLRTFVTKLELTLTLAAQVPADRIVITESGINSHADVRLMQQHGVNSFLVGESLIRAPDPGQKLQEIFYGKSAASS